MKDLELSNELREQLGKAKSREDVARLVQGAGLEADDEALDKLWGEISRVSSDEELSLDELDAVAGGLELNRDFANDGCRWDYTDEHCWAYDACDAAIYWYYNIPSPAKCPRCGDTVYYWESTVEGWQGGKIQIYRCHRCDKYYKAVGYNLATMVDYEY